MNNRGSLFNPLELRSLFAVVPRTLETLRAISGPRPLLMAKERIANRVHSLLLAETEASRHLAHGSLRFCLDHPKLKLVNIMKDSCVISGWAADLGAHSAVNVRVLVGHTIHGSIPQPRPDVQREFVHVCELPLETGFSCALTFPVGVYRLHIEVKGADGSRRLVRRALLLRVPGKRSVQSRGPRPLLPAKEGIANRVRSLLRGETGVSRHLAQGHLRFYLDQPKLKLLNIVKDSCVVSGWAADLEARAAVKVRVRVGQTIHSSIAQPRADVRRAYAPVCELPLETGFSCALTLPVGAYRLHIEVEAPDGSWNLVRRTLLLRVPGKHRVQSRHLARGSLRFFLDQPTLKLVNIVKESFVVSGWAVDLGAQSAVKVRVRVGQTIHSSIAQPRADVRREHAHVCELPLDTGFSCMPTLPVGVYRLHIEVEAPDGSWNLVRRTLLLRVPGKHRVQSRAPKLSYRAWTHLEQMQLESEIQNITSNIDAMVHKPAFSVVVDTRQGGAGLQDTIQSIRSQLYGLWDVRVLSDTTVPSLPDDVTALKEPSLSDIRGEFIIFMQSGQCLAKNALYEFAVALNQRPDVELIYADQDSFGKWGNRCDPFHKPAWSPDYLETFNYIGFTACFRTSIARGCFDKAHVYDLVLRFAERATKVSHIRKILGHDVKRRRLAHVASAAAVAQDIAALSQRLSRTGRRGVVREHTLHKGCYEIKLDLKRSPLVSVVIPTAGRVVTVGKRSINLIENLIGQIRDKSTYKNIEIIVVDNGDLSPTQARMIANSGCRRITYSEPVFNIAKKLNLGVSIANGEFLMLLNDDIEILTAAWIERLLEQFEKPHVGVVGPKLLYPDERIQHAGVVHPFGNPNHVRQGFPRNDAGYFFSTCGVHNYSAVTGAAMMTPASLYREAGGYNEELRVCFNDVDFCMKVRRKGLSVVYTPGAELIHMESLSRVVSLDMQEITWLHDRWAAELAADPFYNDRFLTVEPQTFVPCVN
jgi:GT2 family glycosyltransferase